MPFDYLPRYQIVEMYAIHTVTYCLLLSGVNSYYASVFSIRQNFVIGLTLFTELISMNTIPEKNVFSHRTKGRHFIQLDII